jgi:hypothetical protein
MAHEFVIVHDSPKFGTHTGHVRVTVTSERKFGLRILFWQLLAL